MFPEFWDLFQLHIIRFYLKIKSTPFDPINSNFRISFSEVSAISLFIASVFLQVPILIFQLMEEYFQHI